MEPVKRLVGDAGEVVEVDADLARERRGVQRFQKGRETGAVTIGLADNAQDILLRDASGNFSMAFSVDRPSSHVISLLTSRNEEHRFECLGRNGGIGRRTSFRY